MRQHQESNGCGLPQTLAELNARIKTSKTSKKQMWRDIASKLFAESGIHLWMPTKKSKTTVIVQGGELCALNSSMKWRLFWRGTSWYTIVGTSEGIDIHRPDKLSAEGRQQPTPSQASPSPQCSTESTLRQRLRTQANSLVELLRGRKPKQT